LAESIQKFRLLGKEVDNTVYFNLNDLRKVADSLRDFPHLAIQLTNYGLVSIKKIDGDIYVTITEKGACKCTSLWMELITLESYRL
jgi:hypothetical protein